MKLYTYVSPSHMELYDEFLFPTASKEFDVIKLDAKDGSRDNRMVWSYLMREKVRMIRDAVHDPANADDVIVFSDVDVVFLRPAKDAILDHMQDRDLVAQRHWLDSGDYCSGFYAVRCNTAVRALFQHMIDNWVSLMTHPSQTDQEALNASRHMVTNRALSEEFWHFGLGPRAWPHGKSPIPPEGTRVFHACGLTLGTLAEKKLALDCAKKGRTSDV